MNWSPPGLREFVIIKICDNKEHSAVLLDEEVTRTL